MITDNINNLNLQNAQSSTIPSLQAKSDKYVKDETNIIPSTLPNSQKDSSEIDDLKTLLNDSPYDSKKLLADQEAVKKAIEIANKKIIGPNTELNFSVHEATNSIVIKVKNKDTGEIIREIPSEKILDMVADMCNLAGKIVDIKK